jgi:hypothetical protein
MVSLLFAGITSLVRYKELDAAVADPGDLSVFFSPQKVAGY